MIKEHHDKMVNQFVRHLPHEISALNTLHPATQVNTSRPRMGHFIIRENNRICQADQAFAYIAACKTPDLLIGQSFLLLFHPDDRERAAFCINQDKQDGPDDANPLRLLTKDGRTSAVTIQGVHHLYEGKPAFEGFLVDLTIAEAVRSSMIKYWTSLNHIEDMVVEVDLNGFVTYFNRAAIRHWGAYCHKGEPIRLTKYKAYIEEPEEISMRDAFLEVFRTGKPQKNIQYDIIATNGQRLTMDDTITPIWDTTGKIAGYRKVSRNITNLKKIEKRTAEQRIHLKAIFRSIKDAIITVDPDGRIIKTNAPAKKICRLEAETNIGKPFASCLTQCSQACTEALGYTLKKKKAVRRYRVTCAQEGCTHKTASISSTPLLDQEGCFKGAVLVISDITRLMTLEQQIRNQQSSRNIIGKSKRLQEILRIVEKLADLDTTVLISGESGTGKEIIARALHFGGRRSNGPFVTVNCSALAVNLLESELFGHVKGAFTGATQDKPGRFQSADGGTLLLDEISEISPLIQLKLLRMIQEKSFEKVGESISRTVDARIIACTNTNLKQLVQNGHFRDDLYYRLKVMQIELPPLRQRLEDIPLLADHFCHIFNQQFNKTIRGISDEALEQLMAYHWPGNVRELENVIERAFVLCRDDMIKQKHLPAELQPMCSMDATYTDHMPADPDARDIIIALKKALWNKSKAADMLGISRQTLYRKIKAYNLLNNSNQV